MINNHIIRDTELSSFGDISTAGSKARALLNSQKANWNFLRENYYSLSRIELKSFKFGDYHINVQFNPGRITSTSAKVDAHSIKTRKCFLCLENLTEEQKGISAGKYIILGNPFPIFPEHFTISTISHTGQAILKNFSDLLSLARKLSGCYSVLYNGPKCGASAPDHLHFQAGTIQYTPIEQEYELLKRTNRQNLIEMDEITILPVTGNYLRNLVSIESKSKVKLGKVFSVFYKRLAEEMQADDEPMMNILCSYQYERWRVIIFPRVKHRPSIYYKETNKILISPGCVDMSGLLIVPRKEDFDRIDKSDVIKIFSEVSTPKQNLDNVINKMRNNL